MRVGECQSALKKNGINPEVPGFTNGEVLNAVSLILSLDNSITKSSDVTTSKVSKILSSKWPGLEKSVLGGIQHLISVDSGAYYAELWNKGGSWYAVTGAELQKAYGIDGAFYQIKGITKGMKLGDVVPRFLDALGFNDMQLSKGEAAKPCNCGK